MDSLLSISNEVVTSEIIINKSRFLGFATYIENAEQAENFIKNLRTEHKEARHVCFAYRLKNTSKASDDGEPSGTAGKPILQVLEKQNLFNLVVVVVRYFGGIKLGAGGLLRAYTGAVTECLANAKKVEWFPAKIYKIVLKYSDYKPFLNKIKGRNIHILETNFDNEPNLKIVAKCDEIIENAEFLQDTLWSF